MNLSFNQSVLVESPSLRTSALSNLDDSRAEVVLSKAKAIVSLYGTVAAGQLLHK